MLRKMIASHDPQPKSDTPNSVDADQTRSSAVVILFWISVLSLPFLGLGSWLYRVLVHGMVASPMSEIVIDYVVIGVLYVSFWAAITVRAIRKRQGPQSPKAWLVMGIAAAYTVPVAAMCVANIVIELGDDGPSDNNVALLAAAVASLGPVVVFSVAQAIAGQMRAQRPPSTLSP